MGYRLVIYPHGGRASAPPEAPCRTPPPAVALEQLAVSHVTGVALSVPPNCGFGAEYIGSILLRHVSLNRSELSN